ncbi:unnamed protein product, partial [Polarella glacialis]
GPVVRMTTDTVRFDLSRLGATPHTVSTNSSEALSVEAAKLRPDSELSEAPAAPEAAPAAPEAPPALEPHVNQVAQELRAGSPQKRLRRLPLAPADERSEREGLEACRELALRAERVFLEMERSQEEARVQAFLAAHGFVSPTARRRYVLSWCYPLHVAVAKNEPNIARLLLLRGADVQQCNSSGHTPKELARRKNRNGSHDLILTILATTSCLKVVGA